MRKTISSLAMMGLVGLMATGCSTYNKMEKKLSRGINNATEIVRLGEMRRTMEQSAFFGGEDVAYPGLVKGFNRSLARTGVGIYEIVSFPFPSYDPIFTDYLTPGVVYPDNYKPLIMEDDMYSADVYTGFSGGDIAPLIPGSRFSIFDEH
jgi:putative exosortase-associated protein (TIGR04073 family)